MPWPTSTDYMDAVQSPASFGHPDLKAGRPVVGRLGLPAVCAGNFADVYRIEGDEGSWALKCFTRNVPGLGERYGLLTEALRASRLPFTIETDWLQRGIRVQGEWYPALKMPWVEGLLLNQFVRDNLRKPALLEALLKLWLRMGQRLAEANIAHGDLQHGNVLLVPGKKDNSLALKLIDYDGMFVPALAGKRPGEVGHPAYQHPQRVKEGGYGPNMDRTALLAVAVALRCLLDGPADLWQRFDNGDNLLFRQKDFADPWQSVLFRELWQEGPPAVQAAVGHLLLAMTGPLEQVDSPAALLPDGRPVPLAAQATRTINARFRHRPDWAPALEETAPRPPVPSPGVNWPQLLRSPWLVPAVVLLLAVLGGGAYLLRAALKGPERTEVVRQGEGPEDGGTEPGPGKQPPDIVKRPPVTPTEKQPSPPPGKDKETKEPEPGGSPSKARVVAATYHGAPGKKPSVLLRRESKEGEWRRLAPAATVSSNDRLMALPGYLCDLTTRKKVGLVLRGHTPEYSLHAGMNLLLESRVTLHTSPGFDLDLTLERGRIFLVNRKEKGPATVRLRFQTEVWDLTLQEPGAEVGVDLSRQYLPGADFRSGDPPRADLDLFVIRGEISLKADFTTVPLEAPPPVEGKKEPVSRPARMVWNSFEGKRGPLNSPGTFLMFWDRLPPLRKEIPATLARSFPAALDELSVRMKDPGKKVDVALAEVVDRPPSVPSLLVALYALGAVDEVGDLLKVMAMTDRTRYLERNVAIFVLQRWLSRGPGQLNRLLDEKTGMGLLTERGYTVSEARIITTLLFDFSTRDVQKAATFEALAGYLTSRQVAIAHLAIEQLRRILITRGIKPPEALTRFNPADPVLERRKTQDEVLRLIEAGILPPRAGTAP